MIPPQSSCQSKQQRAVPIYENTRRRARTEEQGATTAPSCAWRWAPWIRTPSRSWLRPPNPPTRSDPDAPLIERLDQDPGSSCSLFLSPSPPCVFCFAASEGSRREKGRGEGSVPCLCSLRGLTFLLASSLPSRYPLDFPYFYLPFFLGLFMLGD